MENFEKYKSQQQLSEQELEEITRDLIQAKFNEEKKQKWANQLDQEFQVERNSTAKIRKIPFRVIAIAASLLLIIAIVSMLDLFRTSTSDLLAEYTIENPYPNKLIRKSAEEEIPEIRLAATEAYNQEDFQAAIEKYGQLKSAGNANLEDLLYLGLSQLYEDQSVSAVKTLQEAQRRSQTEQRFEQEIQWFLALAHLQNGEKGESKKLLEAIVTKKAWRVMDAEKLLEYME
ncbi:MAG: hypothetical protein AAFO82_02160 [Bacteroidota bacterium]